MSKQDKKGLVPKLRFPEFRDAGDWEIKPLGKVGKNFDSKRVPITEKNRVKGNIPYYGASGVVDYVQDFIFDEDLLCISEDGANLVVRVYPIAFSISGKAWVNNHAHVLKFENCFTQTLIENYLNSMNLEDFLMGMAQPKLNKAQLDIIPIPLPKEDEQKQIADCLSSLDELITAQTQKHEALKAYKKGLMQQLFPDEGETVPKLRFPEFRDAGGWDEKTLRKLAHKLLDGDWIESKDQSSLGVRLIQTGNIGIGEFISKIGNARFISEETFERLKCTEIFPGDCLISRLPEPAGRSCIIPDIGQRMITAVDCTIVRFSENQIVPYLFIAYSQTHRYFSEVEAQSSGSTRKRISRENLSHIKVPVPPLLEEQQKIADCLSSLDELITAQAQKITSLKAHKKGLMQQLFPSVDEVGV